MYKSILLISFILFFWRSSSKPSSNYLQVDCKIYNLGGVLLRAYPATMCLFLDDGGRIELKHESNNAKGFIRYYSPLNVLKWTFYDEPHHELSISANGKNILFIASEDGYLEHKLVRFDVLKVLDFNGDLIAKWSTRERIQELQGIFKKFKRPLHFYKPSYARARGRYEITHFNSFKEIPENKLYSHLEYLKPGNFILGANCTGLFFIFDPKLSRIEKVVNYGKLSSDCNTHDVQVLNSGNLLHYSNYENGDDKRTFIKELSADSGAVVRQWPNQYHDGTLSNLVLGSVQKLGNGDMLLTDNGMPNEDFKRIRSPHVLLIDSNGKIASKWILKVSPDENPYRARLLDLSHYLKNSF